MMLEFIRWVRKCYERDKHDKKVVRLLTEAFENVTSLGRRYGVREYNKRTFPYRYKTTLLRITYVDEEGSVKSDNRRFVLSDRKYTYELDTPSKLIEHIKSNNDPSYLLNVEEIEEV